MGEIEIVVPEGISELQEEHIAGVWS